MHYPGATSREQPVEERRKIDLRRAVEAGCDSRGGDLYQTELRIVGPLSYKLRIQRQRRFLSNAREQRR